MLSSIMQPLEPAIPANDVSARPASFLHSTWTTSALATGLGFLVVYRLLNLIDPALLVSLPIWSLWLAGGILPHLFLFLFPLVTRRQEPPGGFRRPPVRRIVREASLAVPIIFAWFLVVGIVILLIETFFPGTSVSSEELDAFQKSPPTPIAYVFLIGASIVAPVTEEFFFRGFLFNAFRQRMPLAVAVIVSSILFGFMHTFGLAHAIITSCLGMLFTLVYWWRKTILAPICLHAVNNTFSSIAIFVAMQAYADGPVVGVFPVEGASECVVGGVSPGSPAERAGLRAGDTIIQFGEHTVTNFQSLTEAIALHQPGDVVEIILIRDGVEMQASVELQSRRELLGPPTPPEPPPGMEP